VLTDGITRGKAQAGVWLLAENRDTPYDGSTETPNPLKERTTVRVLLLTGDVRLTMNMGLQISATIPDITRSAVVDRPAGELQFSETFRGLGDTSAIAWYRVPNAIGWNVTLNGGLSLPTGRTEPPRFRNELDGDSLVPVSRLQRGTGTVDPLFGITANQLVSSLFPPGTRVFLTAAARVPVYENGFGLRTGGSWEIGAGASREIRWHALTAIGRLSWLHRNQDVFHGVPVLVGGGDWLAVAPGVAVSLGKSTVQAEVKLPLYRSLANRQLDSSWQAQIGFVQSF
jgi:hypothetical protein